MNSGIKLRLAALGFGLGLMGVLIVVVTLSSERHVEELRGQLSKVDSESVAIGTHFKEALREVNDKMREFRTSGDAAAWDEFLKSGQELEAWVGQRRPKLNTPREKEVLKQIGSSYEQYLRMAEDLHSKMPVTLEPRPPSPDELRRFIEKSRRLADLGQLLARAHYESRNEVLAHANRTLTQLRLSVLGLLALLFVFALALAVGVYRQMIAPLRMKLVESQALAEQNEKLAALGMLAAGVAHEIRNPLTAIKAALFIQQKKFAARSAERADIEMVEREILRLERIVNEFLRFARPAEPELAVIPADLALREVETLLSSQLSKAGVRLLREPASPMQVKADIAQIKQVLINLIQNASDSIDGSGTITLRARHERKHLAAGDTEAVILEVSDTGKGISPEVEKRLFDPFFTTKENGTGLGLSIAARIVEKHGGALQYQTQVGHGTTFGVVLPQVTV